MSGTIEQTPDGVDLVVTGPWSDADAASLRDGRADGLVLNYAKGFKERELAFLEGLPIRRLNILARTHKDLSPVYSLASTLVSLKVETDPRAVIDLARLPRLEQLSAIWSQIADSAGDASGLSDLLILSYAEPDLRPLAAMSKLQRLVLKDRPATVSLDGIGVLDELVEFGIFAGSALQDISALAETGGVPVVVRFGACGSVPDLEPVRACPRLRTFEFSDGGEIPSVGPLSGLTQLEGLILYGSTNILDGDLSPLTHLPRLKGLRMQNRRHYRPKVKDIQAGLPNP